ncbi:oxidoreductase [Camelimonas fluminis]|uniref:Alpha/beta fold hydrolase n=1 Tax=Camelimonas fluminis TaxID=1576911 RepID=A0ABV7UHG1_9HYPH|nr:alpha/beta hydrolase [Camelimonas fluminis]GHE49482.1 oxidoreductase [Camelimonas fluminis]
MVAVFVHGVPDTCRVWDEVIPRLARKDARAVSLPGFDAPVPQGFEAAKEDYVAWLIGELEALGEPVDLVGHDWGALLVLRVVSLRGDLIRTWTAGGAPLDPDYVWHDAAQAWQTPELGEQVMAMMTPEATAASLATRGLTPAQAQTTASHIDARMQDCILRLYRSAKTVGAEWTPDLARINTPGLLIYGAQDPFLDSPRLAPALASRTGADLLMLEGCGHWWESERPAEVAGALQRHWAAV